MYEPLFLWPFDLWTQLRLFLSVLFSDERDRFMIFSSLDRSTLRKSVIDEMRLVCGVFSWHWGDDGYSHFRLTLGCEGGTIPTLLRGCTVASTTVFSGLFFGLESTNGRTLLRGVGWYHSHLRFPARSEGENGQLLFLRERKEMTQPLVSPDHLSVRKV